MSALVADWADADIAHGSDPQHGLYKALELSFNQRLGFSGDLSAPLEQTNILRLTLANFISQRASTVSLSQGMLLESLLGFIDDAVALCQETKVEGDELPISEAVFSKAVQLAVQSQQFTASWFRPRLATDGVGGIRMTWARGGAEIRAVVPESRLQYLYVEVGCNQEHIPNFDEKTLAGKITKLFSEKSEAR